MSYQLVKYPDPVLYQVSRDLVYPLGEYLEDLKETESDMLDAMADNHGIGLAAVQIGRLYRLIVVNRVNTVNGGSTAGAHLTMLSPKVVNSWGHPVPGLEGCLSFPGIYAMVKRQEEIQVSWTSLEEQSMEAVFVGLEARCILHEIDHLDGVTFIKRLSDTERLKIQQKLTDMKAAFNNKVV
jgi:peptide deformylase